MQKIGSCYEHQNALFVLASTLQSALEKKDKGPPPKKAKKGMATAKQRLGKILKLHKQFH